MVSRMAFEMYCCTSAMYRMNLVKRRPTSRALHAKIDCKLWTRRSEEREREKLKGSFSQSQKINIFLRTSKFQRIFSLIRAQFAHVRIANFVTAPIIPFYSLFVIWQDTSVSVVWLVAFANKYIQNMHTLQLPQHRTNELLSMSICNMHPPLD